MDHKSEGTDLVRGEGQMGKNIDMLDLTKHSRLYSHQFSKEQIKPECCNASTGEYWEISARGQSKHSSRAFQTYAFLHQHPSSFYSQSTQANPSFSSHCSSFPCWRKVFILLYHLHFFYTVSYKPGFPKIPNQLSHLFSSHSRWGYYSHTMPYSGSPLLCTQSLAHHW